MFVKSEWDEREPPRPWWQAILSLLPLKWILVEPWVLSTAAWGIIAGMPLPPSPKGLVGTSKEDRPDPPEDIPFIDPELKPLTNADRQRTVFQRTTITIFNNSNKAVRLAYTNIPQPDGNERSVYGHRESSELLPGQTIEDHEVSFWRPVSHFCLRRWDLDENGSLVRPGNRCESPDSHRQCV